MNHLRPTGSAAADRVLRFLAWASQAGMCTTYGVVITQPAVWPALYKQDPTGAVFMGFFAVCMTALWGVSLWLEQKAFYDRQTQRLYRKTGLLGHGSVLLIALVAASTQPGRVGLYIILPLLGSFAVVIWMTWMHTLFLPPEDQAVIDAITARETQKRVAVHDASAKELRRQRLTAIVSSLGYQLADAAPEPAPAPSTEPQTPTWQIPARKHDPVVYFIRNGNRIKIGTTTELRRRIRTLALRAENVVLLLDGGKPLERDLHHRFADLRIGNTEWFAYEGALTEYIHETARLNRKEQEK